MKEKFDFNFILGKYGQKIKEYFNRKFSGFIINNMCAINGLYYLYRMQDLLNNKKLNTDENRYRIKNFYINILKKL